MKRFLLPKHRPKLAKDSFLAQGAVVVGDVEVHEKASVWYGAVLRGDINRIIIGEGSNVQDGTIIHVADDFPAVVGKYVSIGHRAIVHACTIGDNTLVGMGAVIMDGAHIGQGSIVGAGSLVTKHMFVPDGSLVLGSPAKVVRTLSAEEQSRNRALAEKYIEISRRYLKMREEGQLD